MPDGLSKLASGIRAELEIGSARVPARSLLPWLSVYIRQDSIEHVLKGAGQVLRELDLPFDSLLRIPAEELAPSWTKQIQTFSTASKREQPQIADLQYLTVRDVAICVHSALKQKSKNARFLQNGPPAGVTDFPVLAYTEKSKTVEVPWEWVGNPRVAQDGEFKKFMSHVVARRRTPGPRAVSCALPPDTSQPLLFA
jgi:hypothetical protein